MGKILCDSTTAVSPSPPPHPTWRDPPPTPTTTKVTSAPSWDDVTGLEDQQRRNLSRLQAKGVLWKHPEDESLSPVVFRLSHGGDVDSDGNCLFTAAERAVGGVSSAELRRRTVRRFEVDFEAAEVVERESVERAIRNMYSPELKNGWGVHVVQEVKLLVDKSERFVLDDAINQLLNLGMLRESAAESIYKERCVAVDDGPSWAKYMSISGSPDDEYDIITLQYTEEGLLTVDENREGRAAAFGDDIAIECLATEFQREIYVVQAHGSDAMVDEENCVFFLPHRPRGPITGPPVFLFMKGTGWCGAGGDHYEPLIAHPSSLVSQEKVGFVL
ncbi:hypothetical protein RND81_11G003100 [Saponaria officinalis]|uniref:Uncharacterized protein n=1 Tax=Saponaria officinalis TaxID=3572 RepID=A0AAW1HGC6_SAPOF